MSRTDTQSPQAMLPLHELFSDARPAGHVVGSLNQQQQLRRGADAEGVLSIDNGALRIRPLVVPGWGRAGLAYGPYTRKPGLTMAVSVLNGHNTSQEASLPESMRSRLRRWMIGSEAAPLHRRIRRWIMSGRPLNMTRTLLWWLRYRRPDYPPIATEQANLALGWFSTAVPGDPALKSHACVVHAIGPENGDLRVHVDGKLQSVIRGLQNVQTFYIIALRERGAMYYIASLDGALGCAPFPTMRPLAIDPCCVGQELFAGVHQRVLGEIGFSVDTRVYELHVADVPSLTPWFGTACAADSLRGDGPLETQPAERGGPWSVLDGSLLRTTDGLKTADTGGFALLHPGPGVSPGLIHLMVAVAAPDGAELTLLWNCDGIGTGWALRMRQGQLCVGQFVGSTWQEWASTSDAGLEADTVRAVQLRDDGTALVVSLDGHAVLMARVPPDAVVEGSGIGLRLCDPGASLRVSSLEAHPPGVPIPAELRLSPPWSVPISKTAPIIDDPFSGASADFSGHRPPGLSATWERTLGKGRFQRTGANSVLVCASAKQPCPGRTLYTLPWENPGFAELEVHITPPVSLRRNEGEGGRGGLVFWQDADNYLVVNQWLAEHFSGSSISSFFTLNGYEELYDAVWTNVGQRVTWGTGFVLRITFDGLHYLVRLNGEPVLYRSLRDVYPNAQRLAIRRVGLVANWEWGNDTGSSFRQFRAWS